MFTGIVEEVGEVVDARRRQLRVRTAKVLEGTKLGDSIAVDGVDLTVTAVAERALGFVVMPETYRQTTLELFRQGQRVNLERSVRAADRLSGHLVRGVVEGVGRVEGLRRDGDATVITYSAPEHVLACIVDQGPICVDGVSLTVIAKDEQTFSVSIVAFTAAHTNVLERAVGDPVNLESDIIMRYVAQAVENRRRFADAASSEATTLSLARDPLVAPEASLVDLFEAVPPSSNASRRRNRRSCTAFTAPIANRSVSSMETESRPWFQGKASVTCTATCGSSSRGDR